MCCGFTRTSRLNSPSRRFHSGLQYCPVDSIAISVTRQFFSQARICLRSRVKVRNLRFLISLCRPPLGASTHTVTLFLCTSMPQQRRWFSITTCSFDRRAKDAWDDEKTFLRVFIRRAAETTVPGSSDCVLTRFTLGLESTNR